MHASTLTGGRIGVVAIGRNEGERLNKCLASFVHAVEWAIYVDSGSTDGSAAVARNMGVTVVELDPCTPFTAARARNEGFGRLREMAGDRFAYVQFVDGDCELADGWLTKAAEFLDGNRGTAVACGRLREKHPERSVYNMLCDIEWDTPVGEARASGGIAMMRADAFESVGGFRTDLIAGEESELCVRLRARGWRVWRMDEDMALHDAAMVKFGQWWKRMTRTGYAYAQGAHLHGASPERHRLGESRSAAVWGLLIPAAILLLIASAGSLALLLPLIYPLQIVRLALRGSRSPRENWWHAVFLVLGKFPEAIGLVKFLARQRLRSPVRLIEYK